MAQLAAVISDDVVTDAAGDMEVTEPDLQGFESLDKWKRCERDTEEFLVFQKHLARAKYNGFPSTLEFGKEMGLTDHEVSAVFGWTTGDFRFVNPIARGLDEVTFEDYPGGNKAMCHLRREEVLPYIQVLSSALRKLPPTASRQQRLWRGHRRPVPSEPGTVLMFRGFTSTSYDRDESLRFAAQTNAGQSVARTLLAIEEHFSGRTVAKLSARKGEVEVLFPLNRYFEVIDGEASSADQAAVDAAVEGMRKEMPDAEVKILHLKEVEASSKALVL
eukprot:TRINITY_DN17708_c0_g1_i1.p1 TRINITY_DN17708_c0_g1~~TRINITY_DN17708_c0_g1_i1.p1  ORF type:complete len:275 (-),score=61.08 TRINITY_DN17708_c0_g1_i1:376-1200(-)